MRIVVAGGTGLIGRALVRALIEHGHQVAVLTRRSHPRHLGLPQEAELAHWDPQAATGVLRDDLSGADAVINLAGASVGSRRWTTGRRRHLLASRVAATQAIVSALAELAPADRPRVLINASGIDYYGDAGEAVVDETSRPGRSFLADLCVRWEEAAMSAKPLGVRVVVVRTAVVLDRAALALQLMVLPFRLWAGGPLGSGRQWFTWIHLRDLTALYEAALADDSTEGPVNAVAPGLVRADECARQIGQALGRPSRFRAPVVALRLAMGMQADLLLHGRRAAARRLPPGFRFEFETLADAMGECLLPWRSAANLTSPFDPVLADVRSDLPLALRHQFLGGPVGTAVALRGEMAHVWHRPRWIAPILSILAMSDVIFPDEGTKVPAEMTVVSDSTPNGLPRQSWLRTFRFPRRRRFNAVMTWAPDLQRVVERLGPLGMLEVVWRVEFERPSRMTIVTEGVRLVMWKLRLRLPDLLVVGVRATEVATSPNSIQVALVVSHPALGEVFGYDGDFSVAVEESRSAPGKAIPAYV